MVGARELGEVQRLAKEFRVAPEVRREGLTQASINDGKPRKVLVFVEDEQDPLARVRDVWPGGLDQQQQGDCEDAANGQERLPSSTPGVLSDYGRVDSPRQTKILDEALQAPPISPRAPAVAPSSRAWPRS